jgi:hypothetical protein
VVFILTTAFLTATHARKRVLGMEDHPIVALQHPLASRSEAELSAIAAEMVDAIAAGLVRHAA